MRINALVVRLALVCLLIAARPALAAPVPPPEKLLPKDTLFLVTTPDFAKLKELSQKSPGFQFWNDPAMKPFKDKFMAHLDESVLTPLQRELDIKIDDYTGLIQGQVTFALLQNGWQGTGSAEPGPLLLLDSRDKSAQLKTRLETFRKKWVEAKKTLRTEKVRNTEFLVVSISEADLPKSLQKFLSDPDEIDEEPAPDEKAQKTSGKAELVIGQIDSLLILANSLKSVETVVSSMTGGAMPVLGDVASYRADQASLFRSSPAYAWVNAKTCVDILLRSAPKPKEDPEEPLPLGFSPEKIFSALGLSDLKTISFAYQNSPEGDLYQIFVGAPESSRKGIFKLLAGEPRESAPPSFVPAEATKFQRWRIDGQKAWSTLESTLTTLGIPVERTLKFLTEAAQQKDPEFDFRKNLVANLGNDMISYEKSPRKMELEGLLSPPSLFLLGSPNADQLTASLGTMLSFLSQRTGPAKEREFLGRKIHSVPLPSMPSFDSDSATDKGETPMLNYASSGGYVAFSTDAGMLEEYLRSGEREAKNLRQTPGLTEAAQKVTGPGTSLFGYENQAENMRTVFVMLKKLQEGPGGNKAALRRLTGTMGSFGAGDEVADWVDLSLLPPYEKVARYFGFSVYGGSANADGLSFKLFSPIPPQLRGTRSPATPPSH
jgi:hypothetical protein